MSALRRYDGGLCKHDGLHEHDARNFGLPTIIFGCDTQPLEKLRPDLKNFSGRGLVNTRTNRVLVSFCISGCRFAFPRLSSG